MRSASRTKTSKLLEGGIHLLGKEGKADREILKSMLDLDPLPDAPNISDPLAAWFPLPRRKSEVKVARVTDEHLVAVEPELRWFEETDETAAAEAGLLGGEAGAAAAPGTETAGGTP
jgi:hypothetical protein